MTFKAFLAACLMLPVAALAEEGGNFEKGDAVKIDPGKAYFLVRVIQPDEFDFGPILVRALSDDELQGAIERRKKNSDYEEEPNVLLVQGKYPFAGSGSEITLLASASPGTYIVAGAAGGGMSTATRGAMNVCLCMGTVQFEARPGIITDTGALLVARDDKPSPFPELEKQVRGKRAFTFPFTVGLAVRPYVGAMAVPDALASLPREEAIYQAKSAFTNYFGAPVDRLAPLAGVLDYDKNGHVLDLKSGK